MTDENQTVNQCQHCGNIQLLSQKNKCRKCGYRTLEQISLLEAIELQGSFSEDDSMSPVALTNTDEESEKELRILSVRSTGYLVSALLSFFAGAITLGISAPYAMALGAYSMGGQAILGVIAGFILISASGILSIAWLFTSTMSLHASAVVRASQRRN